MKAIYFRVSTDHQDFMQQRQTVYSYLQKVGITGTLPEVVEKKSGAIRHTERKLSELLSECKSGDTIYISELSRLSRTMTDLFNIITEASDKGVTIVQCKDGTIIENNSIGGKALLFALSLAAEIELNNIRQRTKAGLNARKAAGQEIGGTKTLWGSRNGNTDRAEATKKAAAVSSSVRREKALKNENNRLFFEFITDWQTIHGVINWQTNWQAISDELNKRGKKTATGLPFDKKRAQATYVKLLKLYGND